MSGYPILVAKLDAHTATAIYCEDCDWTGNQADPSDGPICDVATCPQCGAFSLDYRYEWGDECSNCSALAICHPIRCGRDSYCSRACQLQAEYARTLPRATA